MRNLLQKYRPTVLVLGTLCAAVLSVLGGCAAGSLGDTPECETSGECGPSQQCINQQCVSADVPVIGGPDGSSKLDVGPPDDGNGGGPDSGPPTDAGQPTDAPPGVDGEEPDTGGVNRLDTTPVDSAPPDPDMGNDPGKQDSGMQGCSGQCGIGETCQNGQCVTRCQPKCRSDQQCADLGQGPKCHDKCNELLSSKGCPQSGELCRDLNPDPNKDLLVCMSSQCSKHADCPRGTCFQYPNDHGVCEQNGPKKEGQSCDLSTQSKRCEAGVFCVPSSSRSPTGTCRKLCQPWDLNPSCNSNQRCSIFKQSLSGLFALGLRQGFCNPSVDPNGRASLDSCSGSQYMCDHAVRCLGSQSPLCFKWCRPGEGDCQGTIPPSYSASGVCDNYVIAGERRIGRCVPRCSGSRYCSPTDRSCTAGICRQTCSPSTVVQDCCGGSQPCDWKCNGGYCE